MSVQLVAHERADSIGQLNTGFSRNELDAEQPVCSVRRACTGASFSSGRSREPDATRKLIDDLPTERDRTHHSIDQEGLRVSRRRRIGNNRQTATIAR